jgi:hypothetical protein
VGVVVSRMTNRNVSRIVQDYILDIEGLLPEMLVCVGQDNRKLFIRPQNDVDLRPLRQHFGPLSSQKSAGVLCWSDMFQGLTEYSQVGYLPIIGAVPAHGDDCQSVHHGFCQSEWFGFTAMRAAAVFKQLLEWCPLPCKKI